MDQNKVKSEESKVLLTQGEDGKLKAIAGEQDGKLKTVEPTKENADQFLKIDANSNFLENFMKKFSAQFSNPSHTGVYAVGMSAVDKIAAFLDKIIRIDHTDKVLDPYRIQLDGKMKIQIELTGRFQPLDLNKIDWKEAGKLGISGETLQDALKAMVYGHKSPGLVDIKPAVDGQEFPMQARLSFEKQADDGIKIVTHPRQEQPDFDKPFMGVAFSEQDKEQLQKAGHGARVFELEVNGKKVPSVISLDKLTNRLEAVPLSEINIPQALKNAPLSPEQQQGLKEGKAVWVEGMDKKVKPGEEPQKIDRFVQFNAVNKNFDFKFSDEQRRQHNQQRQAGQGEGQGQENPLPKARKMDEVWVYSKQGGVQLSGEEFKKLCNKEPIFIEGMQSRPKPQSDASGTQKVEATDQKGQKYNAWVWIDDDKGKVRHTSKHPDQIRAIEAKQAVKDTQKVTPAAGFETQAAVNNQGKTNEATKHSKEPLKQGQAQPTARQAEKKEQKQQQKQKQKQSPATPKKSKGRKM
ncbi:DUF3945 domain-containing protein [Dysgonomonas sp. HGC4]|uniref:DUF3945 domain-containing protein n=1 Tax=Dysgonomonas sp. HGC4 TaxID=1658009 RepID=UPI000683801D|nr:DUF3945 domain-containing protein [Dysgonomonas sp. HGC4]MBD8347814.1 DUF3945 domain-containing protein [Dysgonomonas sp. HGC4]